MTKKALAIDVGGTKISFCLVDEAGTIVSEVKKMSTPKAYDELMKIFYDILNFHKDYDLVAIATAGAVNLENTRVTSSSFNLPEGYNTIDFQSLSPKKVFVENDANAAAFAEYSIGAAKGHSNTIIITIGTGIGGGIIINDKLLRGKSGNAGEIGSMKIFSDKRRQCTCSKYDCYESYASGTALATCVKELAQTQGLEKTEYTTFEIVERMKANEKFFVEAFEIWQGFLISGLISLVNIFDPESVVISGGMGNFIDLKKVENIINSEIVVKPIVLLPAKFENNAGMVGASLMAFSNQ